MTASAETKASCDGVEFSVETIAACRDDIMALAETHGREFTFHKDLKGPVDPDWDLALTLEREHRFRVVTARDEGRLVAYFMFMVVPRSPHYRVSLCVEDTFFLSPECRCRGNGWLGYQFLKYAVREMRYTGARVLVVQNKITADYGPIWERLGFEPEEMRYTMVVN